MARVFGLLESVVALSVGAGAILTPVAIDLLGLRPALVVVGLLGPALVAAVLASASATWTPHWSDATRRSASSGRWRCSGRSPCLSSTSSRAGSSRAVAGARCSPRVTRATGST